MMRTRSAGERKDASEELMHPAWMVTTLARSR
jgi:hypothetical protein